MECPECHEQIDKSGECSRCNFDSLDGTFECTGCGASMPSSVVELHRCTPIVNRQDSLTPVERLGGKELVREIEINAETQVLLNELFELRELNRQIERRLDEKRASIHKTIGSLAALDVEGNIKINFENKTVAVFVCRVFKRFDSNQFKIECPEIYNEYIREKVIPYIKSVSNLV